MIRSRSAIYKAVGTGAILYCSPVIAQEQQEVCVAEQANLQKFVSTAQADFQTRIDGQRKNIEREADSIKRDAPSGSGAGAAVGIDVDVKWKDQKIILDLPQVTMKQQKWIYDIPQVTMKLQEIVFGTPSVRMKNQKVGQYPEVHGFTLKWKDIIIGVPETFMQEQRIKMHIPEFKVDKTETILDIPEFKMGRQEIILRLPEFTVKDIKIEANKAKQKGEELSASAKSSIDTEVTLMKTSLVQGVTSNAHALFNCIRADFQTKRSALEVAFAAPIEQINTSITQLETAKAIDKAGELRKQLGELLVQKSNAQEELDKQASKLDEQEKKVIQDTLDGVNKAT